MNVRAFEFVIVKLFNSSAQVFGGFELDKARKSVPGLRCAGETSPFPISVTTSFGIDDIKPRLSGEVFEIL